MTDRRIRTDYRAEFTAAGMRGSGRVRNLSEGGAFIGTASIPPQGEMVRFEFTPPGGERIELSGLVWWTTRGRRARQEGFGLRLLDESDAYQQLLERL